MAETSRRAVLNPSLDINFPRAQINLLRQPWQHHWMLSDFLISWQWCVRLRRPRRSSFTWRFKCCLSLRRCRCRTKKQTCLFVISLDVSLFGTSKSVLLSVILDPPAVLPMPREKEYPPRPPGFTVVWQPSEIPGRGIKGPTAIFSLTSDRRPMIMAIRQIENCLLVVSNKKMKFLESIGLIYIIGCIVLMYPGPPIFVSKMSTLSTFLIAPHSLGF